MRSVQVHLFGATSSPSCAANALKRTAIDNSLLFDEEAITTVGRSVDDLLKSVEFEEEAIQQT